MLALREGVTLAAVLVVVAGVAAAFTWPWLPRTPAGGVWLQKYVPMRDGDARLSMQRNGDGSVRAWLSNNTRLIPGLRMYTDLRKNIADGFLTAARRPGEASIPDGELNSRLGALTIVETRIAEMSPDGEVVENWQYIARDERGDLLVGIYYPQRDRDFVVDPPIVTVPSAAQPGDTWSSEGKLGNATYTWSGRLVSVGQYDGAAGRFEDCIQVETRMVLAFATETTDTLSRDWDCAGIGWVEGQILEPDGTLQQRSVSLDAGGSLAEDAPLPPAQATLDDPPALAEPDRWRITRLGRARATGETSETTILPTWLPTDPPLLLAAGFGGDLVAFETYLPGAPARWRFHTDGTIYGQPAYDREAGRVYFGSSDKRLYALDTRGLFLWSHVTEDNVAARPLVIGDLVVAASEDGKVYGLDAASGRERWTFEAGGGVVSWPALVDGVVVFGADDRAVYGIDPTTGERRWKLRVDGAVEAPLVVDEEAGTAYVASRDGTLAAFKPANCAEECETTWSVKPGAALRTAVLLIEDRLILADEDGRLFALRKEDGKQLWTLGSVRYVGTPVRAGDAILAATARGTVERISLEGAHLDQWEARAAMNPADGEPTFAYGPVVGGDSIWLADTNAVIRRLGAPPLGAIPSLTMAWVDQSTRPPFTSSQFRSTVREYQGKAIVVDAARSVFVLDPATGAGSRLADLPGEGLLSQVDPVVTGDTLITVSGKTIQGLDLKTGQLRWQGIGPGSTIRPPVVADDTVLWSSAADGAASLLALDLASGAMRWQAALGTVVQVGGVVAGPDAAYTSTPPAAWDLQTGSQRWRTSIPGVPVGGPALAPDTRTVFVGGINAAGNTGMVAALDASTGAPRWQVDLDDGILNPLDRLWAQDGLVVVPDLNGKVIVLDAETGAERWRFTPPTDRLGSITVARGQIWFMLENARLYGLNLANGQPTARLTELELSLNGQGLTQRPTFVGDRLIFPAGLILLGLDVPEEAR